MNCKPGDLAVIVRSSAGNEGRMVQCLRLATSQELEEANFAPLPTWVLDQPLPTVLGAVVHMARDEALRPIRDPGDDATDETLLWKLVSVKEVA